MSAFKTVMRYLLAFFFVAAGLNHFFNPEFYIKIMPPYLPWPVFLQYLAGALEIVLGAMLLIRYFTKIAAWGLIGLLIAVFPANIHMALNPHLYAELAPIAYWIRLPFQFLFIAWAWWFTRKDVEVAEDLNQQ
jgi:uncharacterized membrane protein